MQTITNEETGEVLLDDFETKLIARGIEGIPNEGSYKELEDYINEIGDKISHKLEHAKRIRLQAERKAAPLEKSAQWMLDQIRPLLLELAKQKLPRYKDGAKAGEFKSKTLDLDSCRFAFRKAGGIFIHDEEGAIAYLDKHSDEKFTTIKTILDKAKALNWLISQHLLDKEETLSFVTKTPLDELAKVEVKID
jgi:hypothetical protein